MRGIRGGWQRNYTSLFIESRTDLSFGDQKLTPRRPRRILKSIGQRQVQPSVDHNLRFIIFDKYDMLPL